MTAADDKPWSLVADIGGTNARFGVEDYASGKLHAIKRYSVAQYREFSAALGEFIDDVAALGGWCPLPRGACLAVACALENDIVQFTNSPWVVDRARLAARLGGINIELINDFAAVGYAITELKPRDWHQLGEGVAAPDRPIAVLGPGTGLGVCSLVPIGAGHRIIEGEGGHVNFAPVDSHEIAVLEVLTARFGRVSVERLLSGAGILNIYQALAQLAGAPPQHETPAQVTGAAIAGVEDLAVNALQMFCAVLGSTAGDLALTLGAKGGVYIAGGIVPRFIEFVENSDLRHRFEAKGRFRSYLANIPLRIVVKEHLGLAGAAKRLALSEL